MNNNKKNFQKIDLKSIEKGFYISDENGAIQVGSNDGNSVRINYDGAMTDVVTDGDYTNVPYHKIITSSNISLQTVLNADTVDGNHASEFVLKSGDTITGSLKVNSIPMSDTDVVRMKELDDGLNMKSDTTHTHTAESIGADTPRGVNDKIGNHNKDVNAHKGTLETLLGSQDKANKAFEDSKEWARGVFSNPNLLINGDFQVWQRGTEFNGIEGYTVDRWGCDVYEHIVKTEFGLKSTFMGDKNHCRFLRQPIENIGRLSGKILTVSCMIRLSRGDMPLRLPHANTTDWQICIKTYDFDLWKKSFDWFVIDKGAKKGDWIELQWVKLELGSYATPFVPRLYDEELALCQRYYRHIGRGCWVKTSAADNSFWLSTQLSPPMRCAPKAKILTGNIILWGMRTDKNVIIDLNLANIRTEETRIFEDGVAFAGIYMKTPVLLDKLHYGLNNNILELDAEIADIY